MKKRKKYRFILKQDLSKDAENRILRNDSALNLDAEKKQCTILFSDINSFTKYFVRQPPEEAVSNLNEYFTKMVDVVRKYDGILDKFLGDRMMVEFGVPIHVPDHAERACLAALDMVRSLNQLKKKWKQEGKETFNIRIGINTGVGFAGVFGPQQVRNYTVIGGHVNLSSRLEGLNKIYQLSNSIIISEFTKNELSNKIVTRELDCLRVKGKSSPVTIFELVGENNNLAYSEDFLTQFNEGLEDYKKREFHRALGKFKKALALYEDSVCKLYINRCEDYLSYPPLDDWDGVFTAKAR